MATQDNSIIQGDAIDLLDCFEDGLGEVLYQMAEAIASARTVRGAEVEITSADVATAAEAVLEAIEKTDLPVEAREHFKEMHNCLKIKAKRRV